MRRVLTMTAILAFSAVAAAGCTTGRAGYTEGFGSSVPPQTNIDPPSYSGYGHPVQGSGDTGS